MATIPSGQKFHTVPSNVETEEKGSKLANSQREIYTMQDISQSVGNFYVNPSGGAIVGPNVSTVEISESILIPADTLVSNAIIELLFRVVKSDSATTAFYCYIYKNTINSISGATLLGTIDSGTASKIYNTNAQKIIQYKNSNLVVINTTTIALNDFTVNTSGNPASIPFNSTVDNYIIIAVGAVSTTSTSQVTFSKLNINV